MLPPEEAASNIASINAVPLDVLPADAARYALLLLARSGREVYAYQGSSVWNVWWDDLAAARRYSGRDGRVTVAEWHANWRALLTEGGVRA